MISRAGFERSEAQVRGLTVAEMRARGFYSAICECGADSCSGWQSIGIPPSASPEIRRECLKEFKNLAPLLFGSGRGD